MLKNSTTRQQQQQQQQGDGGGGNAEVPSSGNSGPGSPTTVDQKPRKKLSFKEPEILNYLRSKKPFAKPFAKPKPKAKSKPPPLQLLAQRGPNDFSFDENPFEEENDDLEELEVKPVRCVRARDSRGPRGSFMG